MEKDQPQTIKNKVRSVIIRTGYKEFKQTEKNHKNLIKKTIRP